MTILLAMSLPMEKAKTVVKLLLELGATSAQADMNHITALHYVVAQDNHEILVCIFSIYLPSFELLSRYGRTQIS
jgi:ankyrin repeat protein